MIDNRRVVITGTGVVSSVGTGVSSFWEALINGKSGIGPTTVFDASDMRCKISGQVEGFDVNEYLTRKEARRLDPFCHYAIAAADEAVAQAGIGEEDAIDLTRAGVVIGSGIGGIRTLESQSAVLREKGPGKASPLMVPMMIVDMASGYVSMRHKLKGPNLAVVTACASATHAIGEAMWIIKRGDADVMVTGGSEACLSRLGTAGFCSMKALSERNDDPEHASRPFDAKRDGFVPSEGAGILVLETYEHAVSRGANILAEVVGYGASGDAYHITAPDPQGDGAVRAIRASLEHQKIPVTEIGYINAHGTSTPLNDKMESAAIKTAMGENAYKVPVSSTKSMTGHALGAAGGLEAIACVQALREGILPPTVNYENPDPDCDLDYIPNAAREVEINTALSINLGFGGHNAVLALRKG
ncbi:MAG: beta-ketoacyl-ACP synthase II [Lentisphaeria bacterium]